MNQVFTESTQKVVRKLVSDYASRKFSLCLLAVVAVCYLCFKTLDPAWGYVLIGVLGQYGLANVADNYFTTKSGPKESTEDGVASGSPKTPTFGNQASSLEDLSQWQR